MASAGRAANLRAKNSNMAAMMKRLHIIRTTARCPICYRIVGLPMDKHIFGGNCK